MVFLKLSFYCLHSSWKYQHFWIEKSILKTLFSIQKCWYFSYFSTKTNFVVRIRSTLMLSRRNKHIRIHYECPYRMGKSHPKGRNSNQRWGLQSPWLKFLPWGWDFSILHGLAHDGFFFPPLRGLFLGPAGLFEIEVSHMGKTPKVGEKYLSDIHFNLDLWNFELLSYGQKGLLFIKRVMMMSSGLTTHQPMRVICIKMVN